MVVLESLCRDLRDEHQDLDDVLGALDGKRWDAATPAPGWTVRDQISHLAFFDEQAALAAMRPTEFLESLGRITSLESFVDGPLEYGRAMPASAVLDWWRTARSDLLAAFGGMDVSTRVPWYGPPMSPASFISARLMETWAHGQDVVDTFGIVRLATDRLRHVAHLGVRARRNSYAANGRKLPQGDVRVELMSPSGENWTWNESASDSVTGAAVDFCLVVTQRRHLDDTDLVVQGDRAREWMAIAQAFAGPPGEGRKPGQFPKSPS